MLIKCSAHWSGTAHSQMHPIYEKYLILTFVNKMTTLFCIFVFIIWLQFWAFKMIRLHKLVSYELRIVVAYESRKCVRSLLQNCISFWMTRNVRIFFVFIHCLATVEFSFNSSVLRIKKDMCIRTIWQFVMA